MVVECQRFYRYFKPYGNCDMITRPWESRLKVDLLGGHGRLLSLKISH